MAVLYCEPEQLPGGATLPTALFRDPQAGIDVDSLRFSDNPPEDIAILNGFKSMHYEHMREWVQGQELKGNTIKFANLDSKYCVGFQRTEFKGMKPHFFVYEIFKREVVRRFMPMID